MNRKRDIKANAKVVKASTKPAPPVLKIVSTSATGGIFVDHHVPKAELHKVIQEKGKSFSCYLMWSDIKNNMNKFYVAQAL